MKPIVSDHPIFSEFQPVSVEASGRHIYDFLGVSTRAAFKRGLSKFALRKGLKSPPSLPAKDEHYLDWIVVLTAVSRARGAFRMAECGAGWAPWLVRAAHASRQRPAITGLELVGIEADVVHYGWMVDHFRDNDMDPHDHHLILGAVNASSGTVKFPVIAEPDADYSAGLAAAAASAETVEVRGWSLPETLDMFSGPLDLLHLDIQAAEYDVIPPALADLKRRVKSVMINTHISDAKHKGLTDMFLADGWTPTMALPRNTSNATPWGEIKTADGFLWLDNPQLLQ